MYFRSVRLPERNGALYCAARYVVCAIYKLTNNVVPIKYIYQTPIQKQNLKIDFKLISHASECNHAATSNVITYNYINIYINLFTYKNTVGV